MSQCACVRGGRDCDCGAACQCTRDPYTSTTGGDASTIHPWVTTAGGDVATILCALCGQPITDGRVWFEREGVVVPAHISCFYGRTGIPV